MPNNNPEINPNPNGIEDRDWDEIPNEEKIAQAVHLLQPYLLNHDDRLQAVLALDDLQLRIYLHYDIVTHLETGLFLLDDILPLSGGVLYEITAPECIAALQNGETTMQALAQMDADEIYDAFRGPANPHP